MRSDFFSSTTMGEEWLQPFTATSRVMSQEAGAAFARKVEALTPTAEVRAKVDRGGVDLWLILQERDEAIESAAIEALGEIVDEYPELSIDFLILLDSDEVAKTAADQGYFRVQVLQVGT